MRSTFASVGRCDGWWEVGGGRREVWWMLKSFSGGQGTHDAVEIISWHGMGAKSPSVQGGPRSQPPMINSLITVVVI